MKKMKVTPILSVIGISLVTGSLLYLTNNKKESSGNEIASVENISVLAINDSAEKNNEAIIIDNEIEKLNNELIALEDDIKVAHEEAVTTYYHDKFNGRKTASGEIFSNKKYTAAHKNLPFGTKIRVTNYSNGKSIIVTVNDRGPFIKGKHLDLSKAAFMEIAKIKGHGNLKVKIEVLPNDYEENRSEIVDNLESLVDISNSKNLDLREFSL